MISNEKYLIEYIPTGVVYSRDGVLGDIKFIWADGKNRDKPKIFSSLQEAKDKLESMMNFYISEQDNKDFRIIAEEEYIIKNIIK